MSIHISLTIHNLSIYKYEDPVIHYVLIQVYNRSLNKNLIFFFFFFFLGGCRGRKRESILSRLHAQHRA